MARKKDALFDPACYDLANHFLEGEPVQQAVSDCQAEANRRSLSEAIQSAVEDWFLMHPVEADLPDAMPPEVGRILARNV